MKVSVTKIGLFVVLAIASIAFLLTISGYESGYADSGELTTMGALGSVAHPPGFALLVTLLYGFNQIFPGDNYALAANVFAMINSLVTIALFYYLSLMLIKELEQGEYFKRTKIKLSDVGKATISGLVTLCVIFSYLFWLHSIVIEVFGLQNTLFLACVISALKWQKEMRKNENEVDRSEWHWLILTFFIFAVGVSHVQSMVLSGLGFGLILVLGLWGKEKWHKYIKLKVVTASLLALVSGFVLPNLLLFWLNSRQMDISWYFEQNFGGWLNHLMRGDYAGYIPERELELNAYLSNQGLGHYLANLVMYFKQLVIDYWGVGVLLGGLGFYGLYNGSRKLFWSFVAMYAGIGLFIGTYIGYPQIEQSSLEYRLTYAVHQRHHLLGTVFLGLMMVPGVLQLLAWGKKKEIDLSNIIAGLASLGVVVIGAQLFVNGPVVDQGGRNYSEKYADEVLNFMEKDSAVLCSSDFACFSLVYARYAKNIREDVAVLTKNTRYSKYFLENNPEYIEYDYGGNPYSTAHLIAYNMHQRPTYITDADSFYVDYLGLEGDPLYIIPGKHAYLVTTEVPESIDSYEYEISQKFIERDISERDAWYAGMQDYFSNYHTVTGLIYSHLGKQDEAREHFTMAYDLSGYEKALGFKNALPGYFGQDNYKPGSESSSSAELVVRAREMAKGKDLMNAYNLYRKATYVDLRNTEARLELAELLKLGKYYREAKNQYEYVLQYDPGNTEAANKLKRLEEAVDFANYDAN